MTPAEYQTMHRNEDAIMLFTLHQPKTKTTCKCGSSTPDGWPRHMADIVYPVTNRIMVDC